MKHRIAGIAIGMMLAISGMQAIATADTGSSSLSGPSGSGSGSSSSGDDSGTDTGSSGLSAGSGSGDSAPSYDQWIADVEPVASAAEAYLRERLPSAKRPAVVFDIDNTALELHYHPGIVIPAVPPILRVAQIAKQNGAAVFFVTNRPALLHPWSLANLLIAGYPVDGLYGSGVTSLSGEGSKITSRIAIERQGFTIVASIGNKETDFSGGHAERNFKLPDYAGALR